MMKKYTPKKFAKKLVKYSRKSTPLYKSVKYDGGFPLKKIIGAKYCSTILFGAPGGSSYGVYNFLTNSYNDPDNTGGGHQPYGHDQNAVNYNYYKVLSSKIKVKWLALQGGQNMIVGLNQTSDEDTAITLNQLRERPNSKMKVLTTQRPVDLSMSWKARKVFTHDDDTQASTMDSDPSEVDFFRLYVFPAVNGGAIAENAVSALVEITQVVEIYDRKNLGES